MNSYFNLESIRGDVWRTEQITNESLLFVPDAKTGQILPCRLLCRPKKILCVCSADLRTIYTAGRDYVIEGDRIIRLPGGQIPCFTFDDYFLREPASIQIASASCPGRFVRYDPAGLETLQRQVWITYLRGDACDVPLPESQLHRLPRTAKKLTGRQALTVLFYGDSFIEGCDASGRTGAAPYLPPLDTLTVIQLAAHYEHPRIRRINTALGGTTSQWGAEQAQTRAAAHRPDLVVLRFGMNDSGAGISADAFRQNILKIITTCRAAHPQTEFLLLSPETPNPDCVGWTGLQRAYAPVLREIAETTPGCGFLSMGALFDAVCARKGYASINSNCVNHPNDFMIRIYASAIMHALVDFPPENMP